MAVSDLDPKLSRLYRDVSTEGPPPAIDAAILAAARQHLAKSKRRERPWWSRWMVPASLMATLVMGVSISLLITQEHPETLEGDTVPQSSAPPRVTESAKARLADSVPAEAVARKEAPAVAMPLQTPQVAAKSAPTQAPLSSAEAKREPSPVSTPMPPTESGIVAPSAADAVQTEQRAKEGVLGAMREREAADSSNAAAGAATFAPSAPSASKAAPIRSQALPRSPEVWLDDIRRLIREGRAKEAAEQLAEFRKAYPGVSIPEDLGR
jgi:type IV secretory pathway VirB10-like protein